MTSSMNLLTTFYHRKVYLNEKSNEISQQILSNSSRQIRTAMNVFNDGQTRDFSVERGGSENIMKVSTYLIIT